MKRIIRGKWNGFLLKWMLIASLIVGLFAPAGEGARAEAAASLPGFDVPADLLGHWAKEPMTEWVDRGLLKGFPDGTSRPDEIITRIQFVALVNRLFALVGDGKAAFSDVPIDAWFASDVKAAAQAGYIRGFPDNTFRPDKPLQRVEAVTMLTQLVPTIADEAANALGAFKDNTDVPGYGLVSLEAAIASGLLQGYPDGTVRPLKPLTRAEAVSLLDGIRKRSVPAANGGIVPNARALTTAGAYGPSSGEFTVGGNLEINAPGTTLRNVIVKGDLTIGKSVGEGDVFLQNVVVRGKTFVNGGGQNSVHIDNSELGAVVIEKTDGRIRIVVGGTTVIEQMDVRTDATIESPNSGIAGITISSSGEVTLSGEFKNVEIKDDVKLTVASGSIESIVVGEEVTGSKIRLESGVNVVNMTLHGATDVTGAGTIETAIVDSDKVSFEKEPAKKEVTTNGGSQGAGGGGTGGTPGPTPTQTPEPTQSPEPTSSPEPTQSPEPTPTPDIAVVASVSQSSATGFRLALSVQVAGLSASDITLRDAANQPVAVATPTTLDGGTVYRIPAVLTEGAVYKLSISKTGYSFGAETAFTVPVTPPPLVSVTASVYGISSEGFTLALNGPVAGLTSSNFTLVNKIDNTPISFGESSTGDGGSYVFDAELSEGQTYTLSIAKTGYSFGDAITIFVPVSDPEIIAVNAAITASDTEGFAVSLNPPVAGLTASDFTIVPDGGGAPVQATGTTTEDGGASYSVEAALAEGTSYEIAIAKTGYSFGASLTISVPVGDINVQPTISRISTAGFVISLDKQVPELDALNFVLTDGAAEIGVDMLSPIREGAEYEVWSRLAKGGTYTLKLDKEGYSFANGTVELTVEPTRLQAETAWVARTGFKLRLPNAVAKLPFVSYELKDESGNPIPVDAVKTEDGGRSIVFQADLSAAGNYHYRIDIDDDHYIEGIAAVPEAIPVSKYTTFEPSNAGIIVYFNVPVPGLALGDFQLTDTDGNSIVIDAATTADGGNSYYLESAAMQYQRLKLAIAHEGYDFGAPVFLIRTTLAQSYVGVGPNNFLAGLSPAVPGLTADNFRIVNASGESVPVENVAWYSFQGYYIVSYGGLRGQSNTVSVVKEGYDFGESKSITLEPEYKVTDISYGGFTFVLNPPTAINTVNGFEVKRSNGTVVNGIAVSTSDGGASYQVAANLTPGDYTLRVTASLGRTSFPFNVPVLATISADQVTNTGLRVSLNFPLDGLQPYQFVITRADTGEEVGIQSATTTDGGRTYRLVAELTGGQYKLKLTGHLPAEGVAFEAGVTIDAEAKEIANISNNGFDLVFGQAVPGLLPADLDLRDDQGVRVDGLSLTTLDGGATYRVSVKLTSNKDYTLSIRKDYVKFGSPIVFHVPIFVKGSIGEVTSGGDVSMSFDPPMPRIQDYGNMIVFKDASGNIFNPYLYQTLDGGANYLFKFAGEDALQQGTTYTVELNVAGHAMSPVSFAVPAGYSVSHASAAGITVAFDAPLPGLLKNQFVIRDASGADVKIVSAATNDGGGSYVLTASLTPGKFYTLQVKPGALYQQYKPITFAVTKTITATISELKQDGMKLTFSERVTDLKPSQLVFRDGSGTIIPPNLYAVSISTKDQGLTYQVRFGSFGSNDLSLDLNREDYNLAAPIAFSIPSLGSIWLFGTFAGQIIFGINPTPSELTIANVKLTDSKGKTVAAALAYDSGPYYSLLGDFEADETYYLAVTYPGFDFGDPLAIGMQIKSDAWMTGENQDGFVLRLFPPVPDLAPSDISVKDETGGTVAVQSLQSTDGGLTYKVEVPLSGAHAYSVSIEKAGYLVRSTQTLSLKSRSAALDRISIGGMTLNLSSKTSLNYTDIVLFDDSGNAVPTVSFASWDGGYSYEIGASLQTDRTYTLKVAKAGYDFGAPLSLFIKSVQTGYGGMASDNKSAFLLHFSEAVPDLRAGDFRLKRASDGRVLPVLIASTEDGGFTYKIEASFWGGERYTVVPLKAGYDFGNPVFAEVPVFANAALLGAGLSEFVIGMNPAVLSMNAGNFSILDGDGNAIPVLGVVTDDEGETYRVQANFRGGETYHIAFVRAGYVIEPSLSVTLPTTIASEILSAAPTGIRIGLTPGVAGLSKDAFQLKDSTGNVVAINTAISNDGGFSYWLEAELEGGKTYSLVLAAPGYVFGSALSAYVPIKVGKSIADPESIGFRVALDSPVPGLSASNVILLDGAGNTVSISAVETTDGGGTYTVRAALIEGEDYSLHIVRQGYDFGEGMPFVVPVPPLPEPEPLVAMTTSDAYYLGFKLHFSAPMPGLTKEWLRITDDQGQVITPNNVYGIYHRVDENNGWTDEQNFQVLMSMAVGKVYTVELIEPDRQSEGPIEVFEPLAVYPKLESATRDGFMIRFQNAGPNELQAENISIYSVDDTDAEIAVTSVTTGSEAGTYLVRANLAEGSVYRVELNKKAYDFRWNSNQLYVPIKASAAAARVNENGFDLVMSTPLPGLSIKLYSNINVSGFQPNSFVSTDGGRTYQVGIPFPYNSNYRVRLAKDGYDLGGDLVVEHVSLPPALLTAATDPGGRKIVLSFDKALSLVEENAPFSVKINNQWQSGVRAARVNGEPTKVELTWNASGAAITSTSAVRVAFGGVNRVQAVNGAYLVPFGEFEAANVATFEGFVRSFPTDQYADPLAKALRETYGKTALETIKLLREAGFARWNYSRAVKNEYGLDTAGFIALLFQMDADASMLFASLNDIQVQSSYTDLTGAMIAAGYEASDIAPQLRDKGYQAKQVSLSLKQAGVSASDIAAVLNETFRASADGAAAMLKGNGSNISAVGNAVQSVFGLSNADTIKAVASAGFTASEAETFARQRYSASGTEIASWLIGAGYAAADIGTALGASDPFANASEAAIALHGAGLEPTKLYAVVRGLFDGSSAANAMLAVDIPAGPVAEAVHAAGDAPKVVLSALLASGVDVKVAAAHVADAWGSSPSALASAMSGLASNGVAIAERAGLLREVYGANIASAIAALQHGATATESNAMASVLIAGGYDGEAVVSYFLINVYKGNRIVTYNLLRESKLPSDESLRLIRSAAVAAGNEFTLKDAVTVMIQSNESYAADDVLKALMTAFVQTEEDEIGAKEFAKAMSDANRWSSLDIGKSMIKRLGITLRDWIDLERSDVFSKQGCPCSVKTIAADSKYLFRGTTIEDITAAMSQSQYFTLTELIEGLVVHFDVVRMDALPYLTAALKNSGYPFTDIAAAFDTMGWNDWIWSFSRNGIAASEVAAYLKSVQLADDEIVQRLEPYPLNAIALTLRTELGKQDVEAAALLKSRYEDQDVANALAFVFGGDPAELWIKTLKSQNATAVTAIKTITARFPYYRNADVVGPALVRGGYGMDEVMTGLMFLTNLYGNLKATVSLLKEMYSAEQVSISRLLSASGSDTPESGIMFLRNAGFGIAAIARGLKEHYGLASGKTSGLLAKAYPNNIGDVLNAVTAAYGEDRGQTVVGVLEEQGITTLEDAMTYLSRKGYSFAEAVGAVKDAFGLSPGETAKRISAMNISSPGVLLTTISSVYKQSMLDTVYQRQIADGTANFQAAIEIAYGAGLSLAEMVRMAKDNYGISSGGGVPGFDGFASVYFFRDHDSHFDYLRDRRERKHCGFLASQRLDHARRRCLLFAKQPLQS
ncbi:S-layer homology domain-containing protein [Cohnella faecalis]|uniref:S-layer homology domain-containing protein n=1 Tax=Cohnella faecalis TaxID=2315694 RepID=UPI000E5BCBD4|nr:S-layer homology domain-containing protein [Cohnella faecalis]